jgi:biopolymer transport protein ExbB
MPLLPSWLTAGGPIMYALLACSLVAVTIALERAIFWWRRRRDRDRATAERACHLLGEGRLPEAEAAIAGSEDAVARVMRFALEHRDESLEAAVRLAATREMRGMRKFLRVLDTMVTLAPLLGILGTVLGIIVSFDVMGGGRIDNPIEVTGGIAQALLTTAAGLVVAIIALIPFNYFTGRMEDEVAEMESHLTTFEIMLKRGIADAS